MVEKIVSFLKPIFPDGIQMFDHRGKDLTMLIYYDSGVKIYWSLSYEYIEILGVSEEEFDQIDLEVNRND